MKALVVDDSPVMRKVVIGALSRANVTDVDQAADGAEAVGLAKQNQYDLVLIDGNMPNMPGLEAIRAIRAAGKTMPIIMVDTDAEKTSILAALKAGATNYVIKPFEPATMVQKIQQVLEQAGKSSANGA